MSEKIDIREINIDSIYMPTAIRFSEEEKSSRIFQINIGELATSIKKYGLLNPIKVCNTKGVKGYKLLDGQKRLEACKILGLKKIEAWIADRPSQQQIDIDRSVQSSTKPQAEEVMPENLSNLALYQITWADGVNHEVRRFTKEELQEYSVGEIYKISSTGYLINECKDSVTLARDIQSLGEKRKHAGIITIPKISILHITMLKSSGEDLKHIL